LRKAATEAFDAHVFLAKVGTGKAILEFHQNQNVFEQGDVADTIFYIQKGKVKVTVLSELGREAVVGILEPGQFFGESCMNGHKLRMSTTTAMEDCVITSITRTAMLAALHDEPAFSELFMKYLLTRNSRQPISPNISQETLAEMIGTTRSRVSFFLNKFRKLGLIDYNGHIEVHNSLLSAVLQEKPGLKEDGLQSEGRVS
jgi:CRP/FNR family transcriptional regulator, cyclic AMP receptor protein